MQWSSPHPLLALGNLR